MKQLWKYSLAFLVLVALKTPHSLLSCEQPALPQICITPPEENAYAFFLSEEFEDPTFYIPEVADEQFTPLNGEDLNKTENAQSLLSCLNSMQELWALITENTDE